MGEKEEIGLEIALIFLLASIVSLLFLLPFEPSYTSGAVIDLSSYLTFSQIAGFLKENYIVIAIVLLVLCLGIGGAIALFKKHKKRNEVISKIPADTLKIVEEYIKSTLAKGFKKDEIKRALINSGWDEETAAALVEHFHAL
ncbi:MAG: hypothetical protein N3D84_00520 [Candidatus Woesearchaeota archaeon]|nr:hypothetical protein [Candidatus Woesearchaeota archaeon]